MRVSFFSTFGLLLSLTVSAAAAPVNFEPYTFTARDGRSVQAELGRLKVPESRKVAQGKQIELAFVRFRSTAQRPGNPIVYLAGGPGGSGINAARGKRFDIFMAMRAQGDVIALDQRGTGLSTSPPDCEAAPFDPSQLTQKSIVQQVRADTAKCLAWWRSQGVNLAAYNTNESAADIEDLRLALGSAKIDLWAISYGTHLGAAYLKSFGTNVGRAVFAGYEGPEETVKLPSLTDAMLTRFSQAVASHPKAGPGFPDFAGMMRRVLTRLDRNPVTLNLKQGDRNLTIVVDAFPIRILTSSAIADPSSAMQLLPLFQAMDQGNFEPAADVIAKRLPSAFASLSAMATAMDIASGISRERLARVQREAASSLLGDTLNFPMPHLLGLAPELDLGDGFRAPLASPVPILFISGTLDGRTYPESVQEALRSLPNSRQLIVKNGGHNIYEADPRMPAIVLDWLNKGTAPQQIEMPLP